jgi:hypothetical protein
MHVILLALGLAKALAGLALVAFGIATNAAASGNTLIIVGTTAIVGGLILIGLASAIRQLRRIAQTLEARPLPRALGPEPAAAGADAHGPSIVPLPAPTTRVEPGPPAPQREGTPRLATSERPAETPPRLPQSMPEAAAEKNFDTVRSGEPGSEAAREVEAERISAIEPEPADKGEDAWAPAGAEEVRIFKSGVIDGMAYTLYTDGSIEAELAQGTVKFSSIDELRAYLATRE